MTTTSPTFGQTSPIPLLYLLLGAAAAHAKLPILFVQLCGGQTVVTAQPMAAVRVPKPAITAPQTRHKRTAGRACRQCGTTATVQWRKGPDGSTSYLVPPLTCCSSSRAPFR